jgi:rod shape-determining protein MreB
MTGGGSLLKNLDKLLRQETSLPIRVAEAPLSTVVLGSGKALEEITILNEVMI